MSYPKRGGRARAFVCACVGFCCLIPAATPADNGNPTNTAQRVRDDKSAMVSLAFQVVQQLQSQQQTNLQAIAEIRRQMDRSTRRMITSVSVLAGLIAITAVGLGIGMVLLCRQQHRQFRLVTGQLGSRARPGLDAADWFSNGATAAVKRWLCKGQILLDQKEATEALACFNEALTLSPDLVDVHLGKGYALAQLARWEEALACFDRALAIDSRCLEAFVGKGDIFNRLERYEEALACFDRATRLQPITSAVAESVSS